MWTSFKYSLIQMVRVPGMLIWTLIFPIVLGSLFIVMLGSLDNYHDGSFSINVVVVEDDSDTQATLEDIDLADLEGMLADSTNSDLSNLEGMLADPVNIERATNAFSASGSPSVASALNAASSLSATDASAIENAFKAQVFNSFIKSMGEGEDALFNITYAKTPEEAKRLVHDSLGTDSEFAGYVQYVNGKVNTVLAKATDASESYEIEPSVLMLAMDRYTAEEAMFESILRENPAALNNSDFINSLSEPIEATVRASITESQPRESLRYYFALLGMAAFFGANVGLVGFQQIRGNASALAARRSLGTLSHGKTALVTLLACWLLAFISLVLLYIYLIVVGNVDFGDRGPICLLICLVSSLCSTAFGCAIASIPKIPDQTKGGIVCGFTCVAAIFAGLYGSPSMYFADMVSANVPWLDTINPIVQVCQAFYATMFYDTNAQTFMHLAILLVMALVLFALSARSLRRQRYASL